MTLWMPIGMCLGSGLGVALGSAAGNVGTGLCLGICFGMSLGMLLGSLIDNKINKQLEEKAYRVKAVEEKEDGDFAVTCSDKNGNDITSPVTASQMKEEAFSVGDYVFLDDDGSITQAFGEDE